MGEFLRKPAQDNLDELEGQPNWGILQDSTGNYSFSELPEFKDELKETVNVDFGVIESKNSDSEDYNVESDDYDDYEDYEEEPDESERVEFKESEMRYYEFDLSDEILDEYSFISDLPKTIGIMGGLARSIARQMVSGDKEPVRDIDLVNLTHEDGTSEVDEETLDKLSEEYMPDDYAFGHGIGNDTMKHYFSTRDFTVNQVLIADSKLILSEAALNDLQENIIRPTYYEHRHTDDVLDSRLTLKALMMLSVLELTSNTVPTIEDIEEYYYSNNFEKALFLNKAMSRNAETAINFTRKLSEWDFIENKYERRPMALACVLVKKLYDFEFRPTTDERFGKIEELSDLSGYFEDETAMNSYYSSDPAIRDEIALYDHNEGSYLSEYERPSGKYTQEEFDFINYAYDYFKKIHGY